MLVQIGAETCCKTVINIQLCLNESSKAYLFVSKSEWHDNHQLIFRLSPLTYRHLHPPPPPEQGYAAVNITDHKTRHLNGHLHLYVTTKQ